MRFKKLVNKFYKLSIWNKKLVIKLKNLAGRSKNGYKIVRTKKHNINNFRFIEHTNYNTNLGLITNLCYSMYLKTFFFFIKNSTNCFYYTRGVHGLFLSDYIKTLSVNPRYLTSFFLGFNILLGFCSKGSIISNIFNGFKKLYIKSPGTYGQVISILSDLNIVTVKLPSSNKKVFPINFVATIGRNIFIDKKYQFYSKAGFLKNSGKASIVRGVAMNPVDHPHGGRTKTNSPEVSIWGWVAKKSH